MGSSSQLRRLLGIAERIQRLTSPYASKPRNIKLTGNRPEFPIPSEEDIIPCALSRHLSIQTRAAVITATQREISSLRSSALNSLSSTLLGTITLADVGGRSDSEVEHTICKTFLATYSRGVERIIMLVRQSVGSVPRTECGVSVRKSGFTPGVTTILEEAYARCSVLSSAECTEVSKLTGLSYQQVRTWWQNKRNRGKNSANRRTASHSDIQRSLNEPILPQERRVFSALPKRAALVSNLAPPPEHSPSTRPVRGLPRRARNASPSPSTSPSGFSSSSLNSIQPYGGFIPPSYPQPLMEASHALQNTLSLPYAGEEAPAFNFTPPTPLNIDFNYDADMNVNIDEMLPPWSDADFTSLLNSVLADPTLAGSPAFTPPVADSPTKLDATVSPAKDEWAPNDLGEDFFVMIDEMINKPALTSSGDSSISASPLCFDTVDITPNGPTSTFSRDPTTYEASKFDFDYLTDQPGVGAWDTGFYSDISSGSSSRSSSFSEPLITPTHPHSLSRPSSLDHMYAAESSGSGMNAPACNSGVLAFDCDGAEWEGYEEKLQPGGEWDFTEMLNLEAGMLA